MSIADTESDASTATSTAPMPVIEPCSRQCMVMHKDPDVAFVCGMIAHHRGAIDMGKVELEYGKNAWAKEMAQKIIDAQTKEIADMTEWLKTNAK